MADKIIRVVVDAMGGDNAPASTVEGAVGAVKDEDGIHVILVGKEETVRKELSRYDYPQDRIEVRPASEVIEMAEPPVNAISTKRDSSIVVGLKMLRRGEADAFVSAGSTGAVLVGGQVLVGRLKGVERPPLACLIPTEKGMACVIDCGANVDARPAWLLQFAKMGSIYMENAFGIRNPRVGLINIGAEEEKGNTLVKETFPLLKACGSINFIGSVEARDIPAGAADVIVADAFTGNIILKMYEGTATTMLRVIKKGLMSSFKGKIGGLLVRKPLKEALKAYDATAYGGAPLLGLKALVVKTHGSSRAKEIRTSILQCRMFYQQDINGKIVAMLDEEAKS